MKRVLLCILWLLIILPIAGQSRNPVYLGMNVLEFPALTLNFDISYEASSFITPVADLGYTFNYSKAPDFFGYIMTPHCKCANDGYDLNRQSGGYLKLGFFLNLRKDFSKSNYPHFGIFITNSIVHEEGIYLPPEQSLPIQIPVNQSMYIFGVASSFGYEFSITKRLKTNIDFQVSLPNKKYQNLYGYRNYIPGMGFKDYKGYWFPMIICNLKYRL